MRSAILSIALLFSSLPAFSQETPILQLREDIRVLSIFAVGDHIFAVLASPVPTGGRLIELVDLTTGQTVLGLLEGAKAPEKPANRT